MHLPNTQNYTFQSLPLILSLPYSFVSNKSFISKVNNLRAKLINCEALRLHVSCPALFSGSLTQQKCRVNSPFSPTMTHHCFLWSTADMYRPVRNGSVFWETENEQKPSEDLEASKWQINEPMSRSFQMQRPWNTFKRTALFSLKCWYFNSSSFRFECIFITENRFVNLLLLHLTFLDTLC